MTNAIAKLVCFAIVIASVSISKADQSLANKELALNERYERANKMVTAYAMGNVDQCVDLGSSYGIYCGIKYQVPEIIAKTAGQLARDEKVIINSYINNPSMPVSSKCASDIKNFICSAFYPKCIAGNKTIIVNSVTCNQLGISCPKAVFDGLKNRGTCNVIPPGTYRADLCVKASTSVTQLCPKPNANAKVPEWLSHEDQFRDKSVQNLKAMLIKGNATAQCVTKMINFICSTVSFCSPDGKKLLTTGTESKCNATLHCLPSKLKAVVSEIITCSLLPNENTAQSYSVPADSVVVSDPDSISGALGFSHNVFFTVWTFFGVLALLFLN